MITCLSLQHAHLLYKEGKLDKQFFEALCVGYTGDSIDVEYSEEDFSRIVAEYCKAPITYWKGRPTKVAYQNQPWEIEASALEVILSKKLVMKLGLAV